MLYENYVANEKYLGGVISCQCLKHLCIVFCESFANRQKSWVDYIDMLLKFAYCMLDLILNIDRSVSN